MKDNVAIEIDNISKQYRLGIVGTGTLSHDLNRWWHKVRGKEDPYLKIGVTNDRTKKGGSDYVWALKDINLTINKGDSIGIIGRNGAGKSTLLKIISRVTSPTGGRIQINGTCASLLEVGTGFHPELSGRDNIYLNGAILGMSRSEISKKFDEIVAFAGVEKYIETPVKRYSSGMYVRLAFAVAAHLDSDILIIDEVLAVGDMEFQKKCLGKMGDISKSGRTIIYISHQMDAIRNLCNRAVVLNNGTIQYDGTTAEAISIYINNNQNQLDNSIEQYTVFDGIVIENFALSSRSINCFEDISFEINIKNIKNNKITSVKIIINDSFDQRIAIIDLRELKMVEETQLHQKINIEGSIKNINLLSGTYKVGLYFESAAYVGNHYSLIEFNVVEVLENKDFLPYSNDVRGKLILENSFKIEYAD
jgi:lipopolysaccharide transport system ATP-binding protein